MYAKVDLLKTYSPRQTFSRTRSVTFSNTITVLRQLFTDFPSSDPVVRLVLLLQVFHSEHGIPAPPDDVPANYVPKCAEKIETIGLTPVRRADLVEVLSNKFAPERFQGIIRYGKDIMNMSEDDVKDLVQEVAFRCLEIGCKGKMLQQLVAKYPFLQDAIRIQIMKCYRLDVGDMPPTEDSGACRMYEAPLCQDFDVPRMSFAERLVELAQRMTHFAAAEASQVLVGPNGGSREDRNAKKIADDDDGDDLVREPRVDKTGSLSHVSRLFTGPRWARYAFRDDSQRRNGTVEKAEDA